jgi:glycosyltransferase involved in cell wall biosynthesis
VSFHACTIVARNYLPAARVLATSFTKQHPGAAFSVVLVDDPARSVKEDGEPFELLRVDEIGISPGETLKMAAIYDVLELSTAVKPWVLETLLRRGAPAVMYLDPDVVVYSPLDDVAALAEERGLVLTPHVTSPIPRDGRSPSESDVLASGAFNLGFVAVSGSAADFLAFWRERLRRECLVDPARMRFVDQRWLDFAPGVFGAAVARDPALNVAYWNLHGREIAFDGTTPLVDGRPVRFFHFSGYDPDRPWLLSKHQGLRARILLSEHPGLASLCDSYRKSLLDAGYAEAAGLEYGWSRLGNGLAYDPVMRALYREALLSSEADGEGTAPGAGDAAREPPNPYAEGGDEAFLSWLNEVPAERPGGRLSRYLAALHSGRPDLLAVFADPDGADFAHFSEWTRHEVAQGRLDGRLAIRPPSAAGGAPAPGAPGRLERGIRVAGYLRAETGVGEHGRLAALVAERAGITVSTYVDRTSLSRQLHPYEASGNLELDVNLVCVNADELPNFARRVGPAFFEGRYTIGLWAWEIEQFPSRFLASFDLVDEVWANSDFARAAIAEVAPKPVYAFPLPVVAPRVPAGLDRAALGLPEDRFVFLFCFDVMSVIERKNPFGLLEAFSRAFRPGEGPLLVIKAVNGADRTPELEHLKWAASARPDVVVLDAYLDREAHAGLVAACDCYVSLHRAEGFGLTLAEAMALGKPVVATGYSGNLEFMSEETAYLVPWTPGEVPVAQDPYPHGARWAEPDLDAAAEIMRRVCADPAAAAERGALARERVLAGHSPDARVPFVRERFAHAGRVLDVRRRGARRARRWRR